MKYSINQFDLFCFDFDGLLVDSERLHKKAYEMALNDLNFTNEIDFQTYCSHAHHPSGSRLKTFFMSLHQGLNEHLWKNLCRQKQKYYQHLLETEKLSLMPFVENCLTLLKEKDKSLAVVTNSPRAHTIPFRKAFPILNEIPLWITKDDVAKTKPHPDGFIKALVHYLQVPKSRAVGLDDALKGITAIINAGMTPLLVCDKTHPQLSVCKPDLEHIETLETFLTDPSSPLGIF